MIVLVCGGRNYANQSKVHGYLSRLHREKKIEAIVQGGATGADNHARQWAKFNNVKVITYFPDWDKGPYAGFLRNQMMLEEECPDLVVAFPGGHGTDDMVTRAKRGGFKLEIIV